MKKSITSYTSLLTTSNMKKSITSYTILLTTSNMKKSITSYTSLLTTSNMKINQSVNNFQNFELPTVQPWPKPVDNIK